MLLFISRNFFREVLFSSRVIDYLWKENSDWLDIDLKSFDASLIKQKHIFVCRLFNQIYKQTKFLVPTITQKL